MINVAILGYGTVGAGVFKVLNMNRETIGRRVGEELNVKYVLDLREFPGDPAQEVLTHDYNDILEDQDVKIVVETMGGLRPAYQFTRQALEAGKSVCTSNKELVAEYGLELRDIAKANNVNYLDGDRASNLGTDGWQPAEVDNGDEEEGEEAAYAEEESEDEENVSAESEDDMWTNNMYRRKSDNQKESPSSSMVNNKVRVVKGGSWKDRAYYLQSSTRRFYDQDKGTAWIGFRCAMDRLGSRTK